MKVLVFTTVFPNPTQPLHGLFVAERTRHTSTLADVRVVSPVPWFRRAASHPHLAGDTSVPVEHPRFFYVPGVFKALDGILLFLSSIPAIGALRQSFDFDLIDAHFGYPDGVAGVLLGSWFKRPVTITLRGSELDMVRYRFRRAALRWAAARADRIIAVSPQLAELAVELGADPDRVRVIGNGVDTERFYPMDRAAARRALGVSADAPLVVSVGHLARVKGFELVLRAIPAVAAAHPKVRFVIVGGAAASSGDYPTELAREIEQLALTDKVTITGAVSPEQVAQWLSAADVFVLASEREGSPNALREALACGCPAVVTDVGDARQVLGPHGGLIVNHRDSVAEWSRSLSTALGTTWDRGAIRSSARRYSWHDVASRVAAEWRDCVNGRGTTSGAAAGVR